MPVTGLELANFTVYEDEEQVEVEGFGTTADLPLSLAIAVTHRLANSAMACRST